MSFDARAIPFLTLLTLGIVALAVSVLLRSLVDRKIDLARRNFQSHSPEDGQVAPEPFWLRYGEAVKRSIQTLAWMIVGLALLNLISFGMGEFAQWFSSLKDGPLTIQIADDIRRFSEWIKQGADILLKVVLVAVVGVWVARFFDGTVRGLLAGRRASRAFESHPRVKARTETLLTTTRYVINVAVFVVCFIMSLQMLGVSIAPLLATAGVASVAIGFGAQSVVRDLLAGFFILFEDQFAVGDVVTIDSRSGTVENLTLRSTKLRLSDGSLLVIPNGEIKRVENSTSGFSNIDYRVSVQFGSQVEHALHIVTEQVHSIARDFSNDVLASPEILGVDALKDSSVVLRAKIKTKPGRQYVLERELNQRVLKAFLSAQIVLPANK